MRNRRGKCQCQVIFLAGVWVRAPKQERRKCRNKSSKIFPQRAKNQIAENTKVPKVIAISSALLST